MNRNRNKVLIAAFAALVCVVLAVLFGRQWRSREVILLGASDQPLSESQAVELSREALQHAGHNVSGLAPQRFHQDNTNYYARNTITPFSGYVLWASMSWTSTNINNEGFIVHLEQRGTQVVCRVSRPK